MFDHYMHYQSGDPRRRLRLQIAATAAGITTFAFIVFGWVADKMSINKVDPPTSKYVVVQMLNEEPPPPPPPPPPPAGDDSEPEPEPEEEIPEEEVPLEEEIVQPKETPDKIPEATNKGKSKGPKVPGGVVGGVVGGVPGGVVGGVVGGQLGGMPGGVVTKRNTEEAKKEVVMEPISSVKGRAIYNPDPDQKKLQATKAAKFDKRPGEVKVKFCVGTTGKTKDVKVSKKYPHDPQVNRICKETVSKWRFKAKLVGGKPIETCSTVTFVIRFE